MSALAAPAGSRAAPSMAEAQARRALRPNAPSR
ncbi:Uncharacterised protein [Bordetella pertussis]|nr:Uncharacterised protein [Bordetella pertussis]